VQAEHFDRYTGDPVLLLNLMAGAAENENSGRILKLWMPSNDTGDMHGGSGLRRSVPG
jgi:hypothetical protein